MAVITVSKTTTLSELANQLLSVADELGLDFEYNAHTHDISNFQYHDAELLGFSLVLNLKDEGD